MTEQPEDLSFSVQLHARDVRRATLFSLLSKPMVITLAVMVCVSLFLAMVGRISSLVVTAASVAVVFVLLPWIGGERAMRRPITRFPFHHTFSGLGITSKFHGGSITLEWQHIGTATETTRYVRIRADRGGTPMMVPKNQITHDELVLLRKILQIHLHEKARLLSN